MSDIKAICPSCNNLEKLETCFECALKVCNECFEKHFFQWKTTANKDCLANESNLKYYHNEISKF
jgi:hypothetical protein